MANPCTVKREGWCYSFIIFFYKKNLLMHVIRHDSSTQECCCFIIVNHKVIVVLFYSKYHVFYLHQTNVTLKIEDLCLLRLAKIMLTFFFITRETESQFY